MWDTCVGLASTVYIRCIYGILGREITICTVIYGVHIRFWPALHMREDALCAQWTICLCSCLSCLCRVVQQPVWCGTHVRRGTLCAKNRVGQNHICTVYIRYLWQGNYLKYGHIRCIYIWFWPTLAITICLCSCLTCLCRVVQWPVWCGTRVQRGTLSLCEVIKLSFISPAVPLAIPFIVTLTTALTNALIAWLIVLSFVWLLRSSIPLCSSLHVRLAFAIPVIVKQVTLKIVTTNGAPSYLIKKKSLTPSLSLCTAHGVNALPLEI